ncbi:kininogen-1-like [Xyrichtys novacula]|uniref:Kininogen-1-like n=1 Tax=Xyrichtys novacula TaxID=13765 RepID=A0AAV1H0S8_XYRNO|nr:kininogen-1-like [Xyrichtys novacula]
MYGHNQGNQYPGYPNQQGGYPQYPPGTAPPPVYPPQPHGQHGGQGTDLDLDAAQDKARDTARDTAMDRDIMDMATVTTIATATATAQDTGMGRDIMDMDTETRKNTKSTRMATNTANATRKERTVTGWQQCRNGARLTLPRWCVRPPGRRLTDQSGLAGVLFQEVVAETTEERARRAVSYT